VRSYKSDHRNPQRLRYGWRLTKSGHIVVDEAQRASIFLMLALRSDKRTLQQICDRLSAVQCPTPRKGLWYCATVKKIIDQNADLYCLLPRVLATAEPAWSTLLSPTRSPADGGRESAVPRPRRDAQNDPKRMHQANGRALVV